MRQVSYALIVVIGLSLLYYLLSGVYILFATVGFMLYYGTFHDYDPAWLEAFILNQSIYSILFAQIVMIFIIYMRYKRRGFSVMMRFKKISLKQGLLAGLLGIVMLGMSSFIIEAIYYFDPSVVDDYIEAIDAISLNANAFVIFIIFAIMAPLFEELLMRGVLFRVFERTILPMGFIIVLSGIFFGVFHLNIVQGLFAAIGGILIAYSFYLTDSLWVPIIIHGVNNLVSTLFSIESITNALESYETFYGYTMLLITILGLPIGLIYLKKISTPLVRNEIYNKRKEVKIVSNDPFDDFFETT